MTRIITFPKYNSPKEDIGNIDLTSKESFDLHSFKDLDREWLSKHFDAKLTTAEYRKKIDVLIKVASEMIASQKSIK